MSVNHSVHRPVELPGFERPLLRLDMQPQHTRAIARGGKTTTLRSCPKPGQWLILLDGQPALVVELSHLGEVCWTELTPEQQRELVRSEGYEDAASFFSALHAVIPWIADWFLAGKRTLHLHRIKVIKQLREEL